MCADRESNPGPTLISNFVEMGSVCTTVVLSALKQISSPLNVLYILIQLGNPLRSRRPTARISSKAEQTETGYLNRGSEILSKTLLLDSHSTFYPSVGGSDDCNSNTFVDRINVVVCRIQQASCTTVRQRAWYHSPCHD